MIISIHAEKEFEKKNTQRKIQYYEEEKFSTS